MAAPGKACGMGASHIPEGPADPGWGVHLLYVTSGRFFFSVNLGVSFVNWGW